MVQKKQPPDPLHPIERMPAFRLIVVMGVVFGLIASIVVILAFFWPRPTPLVEPASAKATSPASVTSTDSATVILAGPIATTDESEIENAGRESIRKKNGVSKLDALDNERRLGDVPDNIYGYGLATDFGTEKPQLTRMTTTELPPIYYEIQKSAGRYFLVGYVGMDAAHMLAQKSPTQFTFVIYNHRWSGATEIVAIPTEHIKSDGFDSRTVRVDGHSIQAYDVAWK